MACLTWLAVYSLTDSPSSTAATIAAPRAWPSLSAESAFFAMNTCSMPIITGPCRRITSRTPR